MWIAVTFINPSIAFLAQCLLPVNDIAGQAEEGALLSIMAEKAAGPWLKYWIVIDATLVLVGAVITAFVGFTGLSHRMTVDRCLPQIFLSINSYRKTRHWIIIGFWILTTLLVLQTQGNVEILAGVYTVAFLSVMFSFYCWKYAFETA
jgi:amino acid transporter